MNQANTLKNGMINPDDAAMLLIDHQSGLFQTVKELLLPELRANRPAPRGNEEIGVSKSLADNGIDGVRFRK